MKTYNLVFSEDELNSLFRDLGECKYREVFKVMKVFETKVNQSLTKKTEGAYEVGRSNKLGSKQHRPNGAAAKADS